MRGIGGRAAANGGVYRRVRPADSGLPHPAIRFQPDPEMLTRRGACTASGAFQALPGARAFAAGSAQRWAREVAMPRTVGFVNVYKPMAVGSAQTVGEFDAHRATASGPLRHLDPLAWGVLPLPWGVPRDERLFLGCEGIRGRVSFGIEPPS